jgi:uncharacterized protein (DUF2235 family)
MEMAQNMESVMRLANAIRQSREKEAEGEAGLESLAVAGVAAQPVQPRNIVICCDGTSNEFGALNTNVVKLFGILKKDDPEAQIVFYDPGVGTIASAKVVTRLLKKITVLFGLAFGYGITKNIDDAYRFLMDNYRGDTDRVFLFGFSRGAYTARAIAGMLTTVGLLPKGSDNHVQYAIKVYRREPPMIQDDFKTFFCRDCVPYFVGVWDTVKSVGFFFPRRFPNTELNSQIPHGRQALSLDEKRGMFQPVPWEAAQKTGTQVQDIDQQWFVGDHCGVGGGWLETGLSDIALKWMVEEATDKGLLVVNGWSSGIQPDPNGKLHGAYFPPWKWIFLPFCRRHVPKDAKIHSSVADRDEYEPKVAQPVQAWERAFGALPFAAILAIVGAGCFLSFRYLLPLAGYYLGLGLDWFGEHVGAHVVDWYAGFGSWGRVGIWAAVAVLLGSALMGLRRILGGN